MKSIRIKSVLCMAFAASSLYVGAQDLQPEVFGTDSLSATEDEMVQIAYRKVNKNDLLGGVSSVNVEELMKKNYFTYSLSDMQSMVSGWNGNSLWGMDSYLVLVDGVPRDANNVMPSEIKDITFLKGASAVVLYGSRAAKGVIYITTKRGQVGDTRIDVRGNTGFHVPISYPKYLGAAEYMTLYNEARVNDGMDPLYSAAEIYNHGSGINPYRYPDVNLYSDEYLKKAYNESDVTAEISGGSEKARFYTNINLYNIGSLVKVGNAKDDRTTRFSVRGNIDVNLGDYVKTYVNANATFYDGRGARGNFWSAAASLRPNRISPLIPIDYVMQNNTDAWNFINNSSHLIDGKYLLGGTQVDQTNEIANLYAAGVNTYTSRQYQFDMGVDVDLSMVLKGLSFQTRFAIDYATTYNRYYGDTYATYEPQWANVNGKDLIVGLTKFGDDVHDGVQHVADSWNRQTMAFSAQLNYNNKFADNHTLSAMLIAAGYQQGESGVYHKTSNVNLGLQVDYDYLSKYYASFGGALIHSARLPEDNRNAFSPSLTLGWRLSKEAFMEDATVLDDLMLTASASVLNTDLGIDEYYMYQTTYDQANGAWWGWADGNQSHATESRRGNNPDLSFIKRKEISVGLRGSLWKNMLSFDASFFKNSLEGMLVQPTTSYPNYFVSYWPESSLLPYVNYNNSTRTGFDLALNFHKKVSQVDVNLGVNATYFTNENTKVNELYEDEYRYTKGKPTDGIWGLQTDGFYQSEEEILNSGISSSYNGELKPGDLKYIDQNGDKVIDEKDEVYLGERYGWQGSPLTLGLNLTLKWKNFTLFAVGTGYWGASAFMSGDYYWVYGDKKYSEVVRGRWTPETAETATYPRLTTQTDNHNYRNSDFWLYSTNRFNLSRLQLTYDLPQQWLRGSFVHSLSVYAYASNLLTISKEREKLELTTGAAPQNRFYNIGFKIGF
ncbi:SusC/RagA family TonB-linked outer membrane protein [Bacteroides sp.]|uniref:SusC/RagA family TonB-linked outer membrane protein n=1 Tax=Bacteroides sp. TaxID=29523 RepID=UPI00258BD76D|nr:SusC/RagA family TonB-linked outer membrane protein [Bacteroides sp.]